MKKGCRKGCLITASTVGVIIVLLVLFIIGSIIYIANPPESYRKECPKYVELYFTEERNRELTEFSQKLLSAPETNGVASDEIKQFNDKHNFLFAIVNKEKGVVQFGYLQLRKWHMYFYGADEKYLKDEKGYKNIQKLNTNWHYVCW